MRDQGQLGGFTRDDSSLADGNENGVRDLLSSRTSPQPWWRRSIRMMVYIALGIIVTVVFFGIFGGGNNDLEVRLVGLIDRGDRRAMSVTNVGTKAITITNIIFNDRSDCHATRLDSDMFNPQTRPTFPMKLQVGDRTTVSAGCGIVRAKIVTTDRQYTYSLN